jgi:excisionase family DNA binding protein
MGASAEGYESQAALIESQSPGSTGTDVSAVSMTSHGAAAPARPDVPLLLTMCQAAERLQVSRSSLYREVGRGRIQVVKLGHLTRIRVEDLEGYVAGLVAPPREA